MTCKDCLYYERCHSEIAYGMGSDDLTGEYFTDIETRCAGFKNKADVVEVVRCKDCLYKNEWANDGSYPNYNFCKHSGLWHLTDNHFCSYGERKKVQRNEP